MEHYSGPQCLVTKPGEVSEEQHWEMLGERLKLYGASRLAEMFRSIASSADGGSRCRSESSVLSVGDDDEEEDEEEEGHLEHEDNEEGEEGQLEEAAATADWEDQTTASAVEVRFLSFPFLSHVFKSPPLSSSFAQVQTGGRAGQTLLSSPFSPLLLQPRPDFRVVWRVVCRPERARSRPCCSRWRRRAGGCRACRGSCGTGRSRPPRASPRWSSSSTDYHRQVHVPSNHTRRMRNQQLRRSAGGCCLFFKPLSSVFNTLIPFFLPQTPALHLQVEEGVEVLVSSLRRYGAFRLASLARGYKRRRLQSAWLRWHAVLLRQAMPQLPPPLPEIVEVEQPPWLNKGLGSEAEDALAAVHSRLQEVVHRLRALGEEVEGQVREREDLLQDVGEQGEDPEARLRILLLDVDEEEDEDDPSAAAAFRRAVKALLARAKGLAQKMVKDMFRELEHEGGAEQLLLLAGNATDDQTSASSTPGATTPSSSLLFSPRASLPSSALPSPPLLVGSHDMPCIPARPPRLASLLPPLSSPHAPSSPPSQHLPAKPPSHPPIAKLASPPPPSPSSLAQRQKQQEDAERCAREEGLMEAVRQRLATQGECVEDLEQQLQEQQTQVRGFSLQSPKSLNPHGLDHVSARRGRTALSQIALTHLLPVPYCLHVRQLHTLKRRLDSMHRVVAQCPPPPEGPPTSGPGNGPSNGPSNGPPREGSRQEKLASRVKLFAAARYVSTLTSTGCLTMTDCVSYHNVVRPYGLVDWWCYHLTPYGGPISSRVPDLHTPPPPPCLPDKCGFMLGMQACRRVAQSGAKGRGSSLRVVARAQPARDTRARPSFHPAASGASGEGGAGTHGSRRRAAGDRRRGGRSQEVHSMIGGSEEGQGAK